MGTNVQLLFRKVSEKLLESRQTETEDKNPSKT